MKLKALSILTLTMLLSTTFVLKPVRATTTKLYFDPLVNFAMPGETFTVNITVSDVELLYAWQVNMSFNPDVLEYVNVTEGDFLKRQPEGSALSGIKLEVGWVLLGYTTIGAYAGVNGSGTLAAIEFRVLDIGESALTFENYGTQPENYTYLLAQTQSQPPPSFYKIPFVAENGYFNNNVYWAELFNLYYQLLADYTTLLTNYTALLTNYTTLLGDYGSLNSSYYSLLAEHQDLQSKYDSLESDYDSLNTTHISLLGNYTQLQTDYDSLQSEYNTLQNSYSVLERDYYSLRADFDSLKADYDDLKSKYETSTGELGTARNLNYLFIATTIVFIVSTAILLLRKPT